MNLKLKRLTSRACHTHCLILAVGSETNVITSHFKIFANCKLTVFLFIDIKAKIHLPFTFYLILKGGVKQGSFGSTFSTFVFLANVGNKPSFFLRKAEKNDNISGNFHLQFRIRNFKFVKVVLILSTICLKQALHP